jgi:EAL domain-containing protein (putative c-di-GMP-specific phosphodiesterase class I)
MPTQNKWSEDKIKIPERSLWQYFNPSISKCIEDIKIWVEQQQLESCAVGIMNISNVASILFSYGEDVSFYSTEKLKSVLTEKMGKDALIIRAGIEDFVFAYPYKSNKELKADLQNITSTLRVFTNELLKQPIYFLFKIGMSTYQRALGITIEQVLDQAFIALFECKNISSTALCLFDEVAESMKENKKEMSMAAYFQTAINENRLKLAFQPVLSSKTGKVKNYEALLRIIDETGQLISVGPYIPIAEKYGFIEQIDKIVLDFVIKELKTNDDIYLSMNVSNCSVDNSSWINYAKKLLSNNNIASRLIVEITETGVLRNIEKITEFVDSLKTLGCQVAIDDFGAGYTSFTQLKSINADIIKIDGIFVKDLLDNPDSKLFIETLVRFAKAYGLITVAEFVENGEIAKILMELGVDCMQGYFFGKATENRPWILSDG